MSAPLVTLAPPPEPARRVLPSVERLLVIPDLPAPAAAETRSFVAAERARLRAEALAWLRELAAG